MELEQAIYEARKKEVEEKSEHLRYMESQKLIRLEMDENIRLMSKSLKDATLRQYLEWLEGYTGNGGKITHCYDYPFRIGGFEVATSDIVVRYVCGAGSKNIIVPQNVKCTIDCIGHNNIYYMSDFSQVGDWVPIYNDID